MITRERLNWDRFAGRVRGLKRKAAEDHMACYTKFLNDIEWAERAVLNRDAKSLVDVIHAAAIRYDCCEEWRSKLYGWINEIEL